MSYITYPKARVRQMPVVSGMGQTEPSAKTVIIQIGGKTKTFVSREVKPEEYPLVQQIVAGYFKTGDHLKKWRNAVLEIRDMAFVEWPDFVRLELPKYNVPAGKLSGLLKQGESISRLYEEMAAQYGLAQKEYDALLPRIQEIQADLQAAGLSGIGNPAIILLAIIAIAIICATAVTITALQYAGETEVSARLKTKVDAANFAAEVAGKSQAEVTKQAETIGNLAQQLSEEKRAEFIEKNIDKVYANNERTLTTLNKAASQFSKNLAAADKSEKVAQESAKKIAVGGFTWLKTLPWIGLAVVGVVVAPSLKEMISGFAPKKKG